MACGRGRTWGECGLLLGSMLLMGLLAAATARADAPALVPVQGFLSDENGVPTTGKHRVIFFIYDAETDGALLHTDTFNNLTLDAGHFTVYLGSQEDQAIDLAIFRDNNDTWLEVVVDNETITPRTRLGSVPYAAACGDAVTVGGQTVPADIFSGNYVKADDGEVENLAVTGNLTVDGDVAVKGTLDPGALSVQEFHLNPTDAFTLNPVNNQMLDVPGLVATFSVAQTTPIMVAYTFGGITSTAGGSHLVTELVIDDVHVVGTITGNTTYWGNTGSYVGTVAAGQHTVRVRYRTPGASSWSSAEWMSRRLDVLVLGR